MAENNIYQRILNIQNELQTVAKNLTVATSQTQSYKAVSEVDILNAVKPLEIKHGVCSMPTDRQIIESSILETVKEFKGEKKTTRQLHMRVMTTYEFINVDDPNDRIQTITFADGIDSGDKASGKAMTYADKYALMKMYKIQTGEDIDAVASEELKGQTAKTEPMITTSQIEIIKSKMNEERIAKMLEYYKVDSIDKLTLKQASETCKKLK